MPPKETSCVQQTHSKNICIVVLLVREKEWMPFQGFKCGNKFKKIKIKKLEKTWHTLENSLYALILAGRGSLTKNQSEDIQPVCSHYPIDSGSKEWYNSRRATTSRSRGNATAEDLFLSGKLHIKIPTWSPGGEAGNDVEQSQSLWSVLLREDWTQRHTFFHHFVDLLSLITI